MWIFFQSSPLTWKMLVYDWYNSLLQRLIEFINDTMPQTFICERFLTVHLIDIKIFRFSVAFCVNLGDIFFTEYTSSIKFIHIKLFKVFPSYPLKFCSIYIVCPIFYSGLQFFFWVFFLLSWQVSLLVHSFYYICQRANSWIRCFSFFILFFLLSISLIFAFIYIVLLHLPIFFLLYYAYLDFKVENRSYI